MKNDISNSKPLWYVVIFILLLFIVLPPLFRVLLPKEEETNPDSIIMALTCFKEENFVEYKLKTVINSKYVDGEISESTITYTVYDTDSVMASGVEIEEYEALKKANNVAFEQENNQYILKMDYKKFDYTNETLLQNHMKVIDEQIKIYTDNSFECSTSNE